MKTYGLKAVWGIPAKIMPVEFPEGTLDGSAIRLRFRFRTEEVGKVFLRKANGITAWHLLDEGTCWKAAFPTGMNYKLK